MREHRRAVRDRSACVTPAMVTCKRHGPHHSESKEIRSFKSAAAFETWLAANHAREDELWLRVYKKASGTTTVTTAEALEVVLCWGWIDGIRKTFDDESFLQRYTPRRPRSLWSQVNQGHVARLTKAGRMQASGQKQIDAAKADGRWAAAYWPIRFGLCRHDSRRFARGDRCESEGAETFKTLGKLNLFALAFRTNAMKTPAGRAKKIEDLVALLARGETIVPRRRGRARRPPTRTDKLRTQNDVRAEVDARLRCSRFSPRRKTSPRTGCPRHRTRLRRGRAIRRRPGLTPPESGWNP